MHDSTQPNKDAHSLNRRWVDQFAQRFGVLTVAILMFAGALRATALSAEFAVGNAPSCPTRAGNR